MIWKLFDEIIICALFSEELLCQVAKKINSMFPFVHDEVSQTKFINGAF